MPGAWGLVSERLGPGAWGLSAWGLGPGCLGPGAWVPGAWCLSQFFYALVIPICTAVLALVKMGPISSCLQVMKRGAVSLHMRCPV